MMHGRKEPELYDLSTDPSESTNVIADHSDLVTAMTEKITNIVCSGRTTPGPSQLNDTGHWKDLSWITPAQYETLAAKAPTTN
jgi:arylsulfatase A